MPDGSTWSTPSPVRRLRLSGWSFLLNYGVGHLNFTYGGMLDPALVAGHENTLLIVFVAAFFGFGVKAAIFPFTAGLPDASVAPTPVSALLHAVAVVKAVPLPLCG